jgi:serine/threonine protein phosphatase 1
MISFKAHPLHRVGGVQPLMRLLVIGDIHGCSRAYDTLLAAVQPAPDEHVITLGDYVDRGPDSSGVLQRLLALEKKCRLVPLRGNHDQMMLAARDNAEAHYLWLECGGKATLASYSVLGDSGKLVDVPDSHWNFLENRCVDWHETETHFFVHANAHPEMPLRDQPEYILLWEKLEFPLPHCSGKIMVCGHTSQRSGVPLNLGHTVCIDTWVYGDGWLTCWDIRTGRIWQANQKGEMREAHVEDFANEEPDYT